MNLSIRQCIFPKVLNTAEVADIFKKLDSLMTENYRPASILTAVFKVCIFQLSNAFVFRYAFVQVSVRLQAQMNLPDHAYENDRVERSH